MPDPQTAALLRRIADALDRIAPPPPPPTDPLAHTHLRWDGAALHPARPAPALPLETFVGIDAARDALFANTRALAHGRPAHDALLWGARGTGKSALIRAVAHAAQAEHAPLHLVELPAGRLDTLPALFARLPATRAWLLFIDDLAFTPGDPAARQLRSLLDGGVQARPANARLAVTSNHRHFAERAPTDTARHARDAEHDALALPDRFGLTLGFHNPTQADYLEMVRRHAAMSEIHYTDAQALAYATDRGSFSGRTAWHFVVGLGSKGDTRT